MNALRVAVVGASGIGRNHVGWFLKHGCEVCAFVGSSPESVTSTRSLLQASWNIAPNAYESVEVMLLQEKPDIVCLSCPPHMHFSLAAMCMDAGAHVLCEKPMVGGARKTAQVLVRQAELLCRKARDWSVLLGVQMQYATAAPTILEMCNIRDLGDLKTLKFTMNTKNIKHNRRGEDVWLDLSPHPLSVLRKIAPIAQLHESTIQCNVAEYITTAQFEMSFSGAKSEAKRCQVEIIVAVEPERDIPLRQWQINGQTVGYEARKNESGEFCAYLSQEDRVLELPDFVDTLIGNFVRACAHKETLLVSGRDGAQVVEWQWKMLQQGQEQ